jgi:hypothetical protein
MSYIRIPSFLYGVFRIVMVLVACVHSALQTRLHRLF